MPASQLRIGVKKPGQAGWVVLARSLIADEWAELEGASCDFAAAHAAGFDTAQVLQSVKLEWFGCIHE